MKKYNKRDNTTTANQMILNTKLVNIQMQLINVKEIQTLEPNRAVMTILNHAVIYTCSKLDEQDDKKRYNVTKSMLEEEGLTLSKFHQIAIKEMNENYDLQPLLYDADAIEMEMLTDEPGYNQLDDQFDLNEEIYTITNRCRNHGAAYLSDYDLLESIHNRLHTDFAIQISNNYSQLIIIPKNIPESSKGAHYIYQKGRTGSKLIECKAQ